MSLPTTPSFRRDGRRALATGAGRGIGLALEVALAAAGARVTLVARTDCEIESGALLICEAGGQADAAPLDVADLRTVSAFVEPRPAFHILITTQPTIGPCR